MIRVLFVNAASIIGGAETNLLNVIRFSGLGGIEPVGVLLPGDGPLVAKVEALGLPVGFVSYHAFRWRNPARYAQTLYQLVQWIVKTKADVVHLNHQWLVEHVVLASKLAGKKIVCHTRNYLDAEFVDRNRRWLDRSDAIIAVSKATEARALDLGLSPRRVRLVYDGIDLDRYARSAQRSEDRGSLSTYESPIVGFCGRIVPEKGPEDLLCAVPVILQRVPNAHFLFAGADQVDCSYIGQLQSLAHRLGVSDRVDFIGFRNDVEQVLANVDILVLPSRRSMPEGLPLSALEGLASGCLVVATPNSGVPEVIQDGKTGFLVDPDDPESLAAAVIEALVLPDTKKASIRYAGQALIKAQFSIQRQIARLAEVYEQLLR